MLQSLKEQQKSENVADGEKYQQFDSGHVDSGFLSGTNLVTTEEGLEFDGDNHKSCPVAPEPTIVAQEPMRVDSGLDLGLSQDLSQLTLKPVTLNSLSGKVQAEPTIELTPVTTQLTLSAHRQQQHNYHNDSIQQININSHFQHIQKQRLDWHLYYVQDDDGDTHLHNAIAQGFLEVSFSLIRMAPHPCLLDILNDERLSPLHLAVITHQARIVRSLVLAGANPALRDGNGNTALHLACNFGDIACARALTDPLSSSEKRFVAPGRPAPALPQDLEQRNYEGQTCLHVAVVAGHVEMVRLLLRHGADLEAGEWLAGRTALHLSIERHRTTVTTFLLEECTPCLDASTYAGVTAYQIAACRDIVLARELVRLGAKPQPPHESDSDDSSADDSDMSENDSDNEGPGAGGGDNGGPTSYRNNNNNVSQLWHSVGLRA